MSYGNSRTNTFAYENQISTHNMKYQWYDRWDCITCINRYKIRHFCADQPKLLLQVISAAVVSFLSLAVFIVDKFKEEEMKDEDENSDGDPE